MINSQQQQAAAAPLTPQRAVQYPGSPIARVPNAVNMNPQQQQPQQVVIQQGIPVNVYQQNSNNVQRSYSPQIQPQPNQQQQQQVVMGRTPIQMMQQQAQNVSQQSMLGSPASSAIDSSARKRQVHMSGANSMAMATMDPSAAAKTQNRQIRKKPKLKDKIIPQKVRELVPDSQSYMDLLAFERKLDSTIMRKRLDIQEALKRPIKTKKKLRVIITNLYHAPKLESDNEEDLVPQWELKIEGRLLDENKSDAQSNNPKVRRKFSSFFKSLVIELDKDLYGPDNHLVEWQRANSTSETDGFQVKRPGDHGIKCTILMLLDYQPAQFKLDPRLAKLLSIHTATRPVIIQALWQYIKQHKLQDTQEKEFINLDKYLQQIFECDRIRFSDISKFLSTHTFPPDPIVINHMINVEANDPKRTSVYDIEVEVEDTLRDQMKSFLNSSQSLGEVAQLDTKIHEQIEQINQLRVNREFFMSFSEDPQEFINKWLVSQSNDLKAMLDLNGNPEEERRAWFYHEPWTDEAVCRYFYNRVQQRRAELEQVLGIRNT